MSAAVAGGFIADPGTTQTGGDLPELTRRLGLLGQSLGVTIYGISGGRTPAHSVAVGGSANDPHVQLKAEDIGVGGQTRSSAATITDAELAAFGLERPFGADDPNDPEVNHIQLAGSTSSSSSSSNPSAGLGPAVRGLSPGAAKSAAQSNVGGNQDGQLDLNPVDAITGVFSGFFDYIKAGLVKGLLYFVLVAGGVGLAVYGVVHAFGGGQKSGPSPGAGALSGFGKDAELAAV